MRILAIAVLGSLLGISVHAQLGTSAKKKTPDPRVQKLLDEAEVKYTIDDDGDFRVINRIDSTRTHLAWIISRTSTYGKIEVRDVMSVAYKTTGNLDPRLMQRLLEQNNRTKIGAWAVQREDDVSIVLFKTQIAADAEFGPLLHAVLVVTNTADELELELTGKDDY